MSENITVDTELLRDALKLLGKYSDLFADAERNVSFSVADNLETAGRTELGKVYASGIRPGAMGLQYLLRMLKEMLEDAHGNGIDATTYLEGVENIVAGIARGGRGGGGGGGRR